MNSPPRWRDLIAGLCVAGLLLPEAVAYAGLAGLPVVHALSAMLVGLAVYAVFGGSRFAIVSPTSSTATLSAAAAVSLSGVTALADPAAYAQALTALVLLCGVLLMLLAAVRQGQLSAYVSRPVLRGFAFALAITIVIKQLPDALGFKLPSDAGGDALHVLLYAATHAAQWHLPTLAVALMAAGVLIALRHWPRLPASMLVIILAIAASRVLDLDAMGVTTSEASSGPRSSRRCRCCRSANGCGLPSWPSAWWCWCLQNRGAPFAAWRWRAATRWTPTAS